MCVSKVWCEWRNSSRSRASISVWFLSCVSSDRGIQTTSYYGLQTTSKRKSGKYGTDVDKSDQDVWVGWELERLGCICQANNICDYNRARSGPWGHFISPDLPRDPWSMLEATLSLRRTALWDWDPQRLPYGISANGRERWWTRDWRMQFKIALLSVFMISTFWIYAADRRSGDL